MSTTDKSFKPPKDFMDHYLKDSFDGYQTTGNPSRFVLRISKEAPGYVRERQWCLHESRRADEKGDLIVEFETAALFAVEREVRADGPWVEILEPTECRQNMLAVGKALTTAHE